MSYQQGQEEDPLAYGDDYNRPRGSNQGTSGSGRNFVGDTLRLFKNKYDQHQSSSQPNYGYTSSGSNQSYYGQPSPSTGYPTVGQSAYQGGPPTQIPQKRPDLGTQIFSELKNTVHSIGSDVDKLLSGSHKPQRYDQQPYGKPPVSSSAQYHGTSTNRFGSFASEKTGNDVKWYVDGCGYFWAVSLALEAAKESIYILDWWLSPELYLRRPPSKNEEWRLDRVLQRAAQRGVKIHIIVYKEVTQALTLSSAHTKHALEALSPNIGVFRHPDHLPDAQTAQSSLISSLEGLKLDAAGASKLGADALRGIYGFSDDVILYWAHHEKLCLIDRTTAFMGGLDLCFGRWDTNQHSIVDAHSSDLTKIVFPGQDYNNARVMDFSDVANPFQNKLDRTKSSRMGWSDISISLHGKSVEDLCHHFIGRWNFIYDEKYNVRRDARYSRLTEIPAQTGSIVGAIPSIQQPQQSTGSFAPPPGSQPYTAPAWQSTSRPHTPNTLGQSQNYTQLTSTYPVDQTQYQHTGTTHTLPPPPPGPPPQSYSPQLQQSVSQQGSANTLPPPPSYPPPTQYHSSDQFATAGTGSSHSQQPAYIGYDSSSVQPPPSLSPQPQHTSYNSSAAIAPTQLLSSQPSSYPNYGAPAVDQSIYTPYHQGATELPTDQPTSRPYEHQAYQPQPDTQTRGFNENEPIQEGSRGFGSQNSGNEHGMRAKYKYYKTEGNRLGQELSSFGNVVAGDLENRAQQFQGKVFGRTDQYGRPILGQGGSMTCQVLRSASKWSNGTSTEHSIQNAYIDVISNSQHFIYIENQFFITATGDKQRPIKNLIGKALVDRIVRAARNRENFKVIVLIPCVPAFAGDLKDESSLGTRAIMEFQYNSINRGENSIMKLIAKANINPMDYIRFYNLRNYDRIRADNTMYRVEQQAGVLYENARKQHDDMVGAGYGVQGEQTGIYPGAQGAQYQQWQTAAHAVDPKDSGRWDSVSECYMLGGEDIRNVPWDGDPESELRSFVSEELYIHSKVMIADDRIVICGSANLNDRSQLGSHDSEIALLINDPTPVESSMAGQPWTASRFASSLRRQLFRKHLGLLRPQNMQQPDANFEPVGAPNNYDWNSPEDRIVSDPLSQPFLSLWNTRARTNTDMFRKAFRAVPDDNVFSWSDYKEFYEYYFHDADLQAEGKDKKKRPPLVDYGHVVREDFPGGVKELKELLSKIKGTLVEMPLCFLQHEDIAKEGLTLNALTEELYT